MPQFKCIMEYTMTREIDCSADSYQEAEQMLLTRADIFSKQQETDAAKCVGVNIRDVKLFIRKGKAK